LRVPIIQAPLIHFAENKGGNILEPEADDECMSYGRPHLAKFQGVPEDDGGGLNNYTDDDYRQGGTPSTRRQLTAPGQQ